MKVLNNYAGIIALATLGIVVYTAFIQVDDKGESAAGKFFGRK